ncbi:MAG: Uncharacterised protein [Cryomorphaceae bacterium]|nr:MAG: Uncharacterised protein [Cryomorphaceae bacterium]
MMGYQTGSYPEQPVVPLQQARKRASDELYAMRKSAAVRGEGSRLLHRHVNPGPRKS